MGNRWGRMLSAALVTVSGLVATGGWDAGPAEASLDRTPVDLGTLGGSSSQANALNNSGTVVGSAEDASSQDRAFVWTPTGGMVDLGTLGGTTSSAADVNDAEQVVGSAATGAGATHAFVWDSVNGMTDLGTLGGTTSSASAINATGQVVGQSTTATGATHAFVWDSVNGMTDIPTLGGTVALPAAVNDAGVVAGNSKIAGDASFHAFVWTAGGGTVDLGTLGSTASWANAINAVGTVVGYSEIGPSFTDQRAFRWTEGGGMVDLGTLGLESRATAINDAGIVAGTSRAPGNFVQTPVTWTAATGIAVVPYDDVFANAGAEPLRINTSGQMAGDVASGSAAFVSDRAGGTAVLAADFPLFAHAASDLNDVGDVAGNRTVSGQRRATIWSTGTARSVSIAGASISEGDSGTRTLDLAVSLSSPSPTTVTVRYTAIRILTNTAPRPGDATDPSDFTDVFRKKLTWPAGTQATTRYARVALPPDTVAEGDERFKVLLTDPTGDVTLGTSAVAAHILDDDPGAGPLVSVGDAGVWEGDSGTLGNRAHLKITLDAPAAAPMTVRVTVAPGTATAPDDFRAFGWTARFAVGAVSKTVDVLVYPDVTPEDDETVTVTLSSPTGGLSIGRGTGTVTIQDDDR